MGLQVKNIQDQFLNANVVYRIMYITLAIFLISLVFNTFSFFLNKPSNFIFDWFALGPDFGSLLHKPWTLITYGFLHDGFLHILFNLVMLYYFGTLFLDYFTEKQFLYYYFGGIVFGGLIFQLSYNFLPALKSSNSLLVGASAGVMSILAGLTTLIPNYALRFQFIGFVKLKYLLFFVLMLDLLQMPMGNAGGHLAHLGGALTGFLITLNFVNKGISAPKNGIQRKKTKSKNLRTVHRKENLSGFVAQIKNEEQKKIDVILDKISKSGYDALSSEEKQFLFDTGKK